MLMLNSVLWKQKVTGLSKLIEDAEAFAAWAHGLNDQRRKFSGEPYIVHPIEVAKFVRQYGGNDEMVAAALLHDTVEDCDVTHNDIFIRFGFAVGHIVYQLTDCPKDQIHDRNTRKRLDIERLRHASPEAQTVKLADILSNLSDIDECPTPFVERFVKEKRAMLDVLNHGDSGLYLLVENRIEFLLDTINKQSA